jgi:hypothetical protein
MSEAVVCGGRTDTTTATNEVSQHQQRRRREEVSGRRNGGIEEPKVKWESWRASPEGEGNQARTGLAVHAVRYGVRCCGPVDLWSAPDPQPGEGRQTGQGGAAQNTEHRVCFWRLAVHIAALCCVWSRRRSALAVLSCCHAGGRICRANGRHRPRTEKGGAIRRK